MNKIFYEWSRDKMINGTKCFLKDSYSSTSERVASSLYSSDILEEYEYTTFEERLRRNLWQPDVRDDDKPLWLEKGGKGPNSYLSFGCIHCHRGTMLWYKDENFKTSLEEFFWR